MSVVPKDVGNWHVVPKPQARHRVDLNAGPPRK